MGEHDANLSAAMSTPPGIPNHEMLRVIGRGAYGEIWLARNIMGTYRAIKIIYRRNFKDDRPYNREFEGISRFEPVSRSHEGLIDILEVGRDDQAGFFYYVMELADDRVRGQDLDPACYRPKTLASELHHQLRIPFQQCLELGLSLTSALGHLHHHGLVHRDIKPSNIIFVNGILKLADIGLVTEIGHDASFVGSPGYIAPEGPGSAQADLYGLGKVLYEICTGKDRLDFPDLPTALVEGSGQEELLEFNELITKACRQDWRARYQTARELNADLLLLKGGKSVRRLRLLERRLVAVTKFMVIAAALLITGSVLTFQVVREGRRAAEDRQRRVGTYVAQGTRAMEDLDLINALPWFVEALRLEQADSNREQLHRLRIGSVLERCPRIVQMWFLPDPLNYGEFGPEGRSVLLSDEAGRIGLWNVARHHLMAPWDLLQPATGQYATLSPDGAQMAAIVFPPESHPQRSSSEHLVHVWDTASAQLLQVLRHDAALYSLQFDPDGTRLLAASVDHTAILWDWQKDQRVQVYRGHDDEVFYAGFSPDGQYVVTASADFSARVWHKISGQPVGQPLRHGNWVYHAAFSPDHQLLATGGFDRTARIWNLQTGLEKVAPLSHGDGVMSVAFSPDGQVLLTSCLDSAVRLWEVNTGRQVPPRLEHSSRVLHAEFHPDGLHLLSICIDGSVRLWKLTSPAPLPPVVPWLFSPMGDRFLIPNDSSTEVRDARTGQVVSVLQGSLLSNSQTSFNSDGTRLLTVVPGDTTHPAMAQVWRTDLGGAIAVRLPLQDSSFKVSLTPPGDLCLVYGPTTLSLWNLASASRLYSLALTNGPIRQVVFDRSGNHMALIMDQEVELRRTITGQPLYPPLPHPAPVTHAEFSSHGLLLVTACSDQSLKPYAAQLWNVRSGRPQGPPLRHRDGVLHATFSPDNRRIVTSSEDFTALIWDTESGRQLAPPLEHSDQVHMAQFSRNGLWVVTAGQDGVARIWDAATGDPVTPPFQHPASLRQAWFVGNDDQIITLRGSGESRIWNLPLTDRSFEELVLLARVISGQQRDSFGTMVSPTPKTLQDSWNRLQGLTSDSPENPGRN